MKTTIRTGRWFPAIALCAAELLAHDIRKALKLLKDAGVRPE